MLFDWITEARLALIISSASAFMTVFYTRRLARNDSERMKRKGLVFELHPGLINQSAMGWADNVLVVRNLEPIGAIVESIRCRKKKASVHTRESATEDHGTPWSPEISPEAPPKAQREAPIGRRIAPAGSPRRDSSPGDTLHIWLLTQGVESLKDLDVSWSWADGQKR